MYKLSVSKNQLRVIMDALECYFRTHLGQYFDLANDIAFNGYDYEKDKANGGSEFNRRINCRNDAQEIFNQAFELAKPRYTKADEYYQKTPDMRNAIDIWHVIRHHFWKENPDRRDDTTDSYPPFPTADEELIKVERIDE